MTTARQNGDLVDSTRMRDQPSLTTASGTNWVVVGGLFAAIALVVVIPLIAFPPAGLALGAAIAILVLYVGMILTRALVPPGRRRLGMLAAGMLLIAGVALLAVAIVAATAWEAAGYPASWESFSLF